MKTVEHNSTETNTCGNVLHKNSSQIPISGGHVSIVDMEDFPVLEHRSWYLHCGYARTNIGGKNVYMHRYIMGAKSDEVCDHINGDRLDNRRSNLRIVDRFTNARNKTTGTGYLGVYPVGNQWGARLVRLGKTYYFGAHETKELAAYIVDVARIEFDGELHRPNIANFSIDDAARAEILSMVRIVFDDKQKLTPSQIKRIQKSYRSDKYLSKRFGVRLSIIKSARNGK